MAKTVLPIDPQLVENLRVAKGNLAIAQKAVQDAEGAIYVAGGANIPEKGTVHFQGVKVVTDFYQKWDDKQLAAAEVEWPKHSNLPFPFKRTYKADGKAITYIRENAKETYEVISPALTLTPKKPSFVLEGEKETE